MIRALASITLSVLCATAARTQTRDQELEVYEIPDLLTAALADGKKPDAKDLGVFGETQHNGRRRMRKLAEMFKDLVPLGIKDRIRAVGSDYVVVLAPAPVQAKVRALVNRNKKARQKSELVRLSVRVLAMSEAFHATRFAEPLAAEKGKTKPIVVDNKAFGTLLDDSGAQSLRSSSIRLNPLRVVHDEATTKSAYVKSYKLEVEKMSAIADPVIDTIQDGLIFEACAALRAKDVIAVSLDATIATLERPIKTVKQKLRRWDVTIQKPNVETRQLHTTVVIPSGGTVLYDLGKVHDKFQVVAIQAEHITK